MGFGFKIKGSKWLKRGLFAATGQPAFLDRKVNKKIRKKLGLTSKSKLVRSLRRNLLGKAVSPSMPSSASTYQHQARTLSQLTGGV